MKFVVRKELRVEQNEWPLLNPELVRKVGAMAINRAPLSGFEPVTRKQLQADALLPVTGRADGSRLRLPRQFVIAHRRLIDKRSHDGRRLLHVIALNAIEHIHV